MVMTTSSDYWKKREQENRKRNIRSEAEYAQEIRRTYEFAMDQIQREIDSFYAKYAEKEGITIAQAKKRASKLDMEEYSRKAKKYVKEKNFSKQANDEMRLYNLTMKVNRLELLKASIGLELVSAFDELQRFYEQTLTDRTMDEFTRQAGILGSTVPENAAAMAATIVNASFRNATYSERIWMHQDLLKNELGRLLTTGMIQGRNPRVLARELRKTFNTSIHNSERLMQTELARVQTAAAQQSYMNNGFEEYEYLACHNLDACATCKALDGKIFKVEKMMPGENAPPMHPYCHCATTAHMDLDSYQKWLDGYKDHKLGMKIWQEVSENGRYDVGKDITREYLSSITPGKGKISYSPGYNKETHKSEVEMAEWILKNVGGNVEVLSEVEGYKVLTPDYRWNKKLWDLKMTTTEKSANSAIRHGLKQIQNNPGGIILNYEDRNISLNVLRKVISKRINASAKQSVDIVIIQDDRIVQVLRYKK